MDFRRKCKKRSFREQVTLSIELGKVHDEARKVEDQVTEGLKARLRNRSFLREWAVGRQRERSQDHICIWTDSSIYWHQKK